MNELINLIASVEYGAKLSLKTKDKFHPVELHSFCAKTINCKSCLSEIVLNIPNYFEIPFRNIRYTLRIEVRDKIYFCYYWAVLEKLEFTMAKPHSFSLTYQDNNGIEVGSVIRTRKRKT